MLLGPNTVLFYFGTFLTLFVGIFYLITLFENREKISDPKAKRFPKISIIVPAYNEAKTIRGALESLLQLNYPKDQFEIVMVNDGSIDDTFKIAQEFSQVRSFTKENGGKGSAINFGLEKVQGEFVVVLDADSFVSKNILKTMIGYFEDNQIMAVTPTLKVYNPKGFWQKLQYIEYLFSVFFRKIFSFLGSVYVTPGPFSIYRKSFFDQYGGFDENNLTEDMEIALRIQAAGYEIENSIHAEVFTVAPDNFKELLHQRIRWYTGVIENIYTYRHLFGLHKGNLGAFVLPAMMVSIFMVIAYLGYYGTVIMGRVIDNIHHISLVNFDLASVVSRYLADFSIVKYISPFSLLVVILAIFVAGILMLAKIYSKDKSNVMGGFLLYFVTYGPIFSVFWFSTLVCKILQVKIRW